MNAAAGIANLGKQDPIKLAFGAVIVIAFVYYLTRKTVSDVVEGAGGIVSGNNALTKGTVYEGGGVLFGTVGAAVNSATGGAGVAVGEKLGNWAYDFTHTDDGKSYWELMSEKISGD